MPELHYNFPVKKLIEYFGDLVMEVHHLSLTVYLKD
jgi:hypothetical protein